MVCPQTSWFLSPFAKKVKVKVLFIISSHKLEYELFHCVRDEKDGGKQIKISHLYSRLCNMQDQLTLPLRQQLLIHTEAWKLLRWEGAASVTESSRWKGWTCSFPWAVDSRADFQVTMGDDHPWGPDLCGNRQENSWSWAVLPLILLLSSHLARADSARWHGHSPYRQTIVPDSLLLSQAYTINGSFDSLRWL